MDVNLVLVKFGESKSPIQQGGDGSLNTYIEFTGRDVCKIIEQLMEQFGQRYSCRFGFTDKRTKRQKEIAELSEKLLPLLEKEKHISGQLWSEILPRPSRPTIANPPAP